MNQISRLLALCSVTGLSLVASCTAAPKQDNQRQTIKDVRTQQVLGNQFRSGFYYYDAKINGQTPLEKIEGDLNRMADLGFNYVHANVAVYEGKIDYPQIDLLLKVCAQRNMAVRLQCTGAAYLSNALAGRRTDQWKAGWSVERMVKAVAPFIKKYQKNPSVIGFSVQEEPDMEVLPVLHEYYRAILEEVPDAPLILLYNRLDVAVADKENCYPQHISHDNFPFKRTEVNRLYNFRTPGFAVEFYASHMDALQQLAQSKGQAFEAAFTGFAEKAIISGSARDNELAKKNNQGNSLSETGEVLRWNRYRPPVNYVSAMCWIALSKGADSVADYAWIGVSKSEKRKAVAVHALGWDNTGSLVLDEFSAFAKKIRPFGKLMRSVSRDFAGFKEPKNVSEIVPIFPVNSSTLQFAENDAQNVVWDSFTVPGYAGKMVVVVNTRIGSWSDGKSPQFLSKEDLFRIDDTGELRDFVPFTKNRELEAKVLPPQTKATDLMTGEVVSFVEGKIKLGIAPGQGRILFLSPQESDEAQRLMKEFGLPAAPKKM